MKNVIYKPFVPHGEVSVPPSKSDVHRAVICAMLSGGICKISPVALSNDINATIDCARALGAKIELENDILTVDGTEVFKNKAAALDCGESGSTLRFFVPVAAAGGVSASFEGHGSLVSRPVGIYADILPQNGVECHTGGRLPLSVSGQLKSGRFELPGNISSQFITGLLFALPLLEGDSDIVLTSPPESVGYIEMTLRTMSKFGVSVEATDDGWHISGGQIYVPTDYTTDGDWSQAAFFMVSAAIGGSVTVKNVSKSSAQGDREIAKILRRFGVRVEQSENRVTVEKGEMSALILDASQIPDLVPALAVCACFAEGTTRIINAARLRLKESDRLSSTADMINALGGKVRELADGLEITGVGRLSGGSVDGCNDHRIVMAAAACASGADGEIICSDALSVNKSFPNFFEVYNSFGGHAELID